MSERVSKSALQKAIQNLHHSKGSNPNFGEVAEYLETPVADVMKAMHEYGVKLSDGGIVTNHPLKPFRIMMGEPHTDFTAPPTEKKLEEEPVGYEEAHQQWEEDKEEALERVGDEIEWMEFDLNSLGTLYRIPKHKWREMVRDYVAKENGGGGKTAAEISKDYSIPRKVVEEMFRKEGISHSSSPHIEEDLQSKSENELVEESLLFKEQRVVDDYQKRLHKKAVDNFDKYHQIVTNRELLGRHLLSRLSDIEIPTATHITPPTPANGTPTFIAHCPTADMHFGKFVWGKSDFGADYDLDKAYERLVTHGNYIAEWLQNENGFCEKVYLSDLGDFLHSINGKTESGTQIGEDSRTTKVYDMAFQAKVAQIDAVRAHAGEVHCHVALGNHAGVAEYFLQHGLSQYYRNEPNVNVHLNVKTQDYFRVGDSLHILDHGRGVSSLNTWRAKSQAEVVAREVAGEDYVGVRNIYYYVGHLHEFQVGSHGKHMELQRLPSFGESDEYETSLRYASRPAAHLYRFDDLGRIACQDRFYFDEEGT